jgi:hypothetical protein
VGRRGKPAAASILALWGGLAAVLGGVLFATWGYVDRNDAPSYFTAIADALGVVVPLLFLVGLAGLYARCKGRAGRLGRMGFILGLTGSGVGVVPGLMNAFDWYAWLAYPGQRVLFLFAFNWLIWLFAGLTLVGSATVTKKGPRSWGAFSLMMGAFGWVYYVTDPGGIVQTRAGHVGFGVLFSLSWVALGYALLRERSTANERPTRAR